MTLKEEVLKVLEEFENQHLDFSENAVHYWKGYKETVVQYTERLEYQLKALGERL